MAEVGSILTVEILELIPDEEKKELAWLGARPIDVDRTRKEPYTAAQAIDIAKRGQVLQKSVGSIVPSAGPKDARIAFVGASPGAVEAARGEPFVGPSGETLTELYLKPLGLSRKDVFLTNAVPTYLTDDKGRVREPTEDEIAEWQGWLGQELDRASPQVIIALGQVAKSALGDRADFVLPHPMAVRRFGDSGEVGRKLKQIKQALDRVVKADNLKLRQPLTAPGGKTQVADKIIAMFPPHRIYVEPYAGGAAVFWAKEPSEKEVLNDLNPEIMAVYRFLKGASDKELEAFSRREWEGKESLFDRLAESRPHSLPDRAYRCWYVSRFGYLGPNSTKGNFRHATDGETADVSLDRLRKLHDRLQGVGLGNKNALEIVREYDSADTLFYLDPPYPAGRAEDLYSYEQDADHFAKLLDLLKDIKGKFILSCSPDSIKEIDLPDVWRVQRIAVPYTLREGPRIRYELLITNFHVRKADLEEGDTRAEISAKWWAENWQKMFPPDGKGRFVYHHHWRGLSEEETKFDEEELLKTDHSLHGDLRFEADGELWGFSVFLGTAEENRQAGGDRLISLPKDDNLQGQFKLPQPKAWLDVGVSKPMITEPGGVGATSEKYSKFFAYDRGTYEIGVWREHMLEIFLHGEKLKGRFLIEYAPIGGRRVWLIDKPKDQTGYAESRKLPDVIGELREKGQRWLVWRDPEEGDRPRLIDVRSGKVTKEYHAAILKADDERQLVYGVVLEPNTVDTQGDMISADEIEKAAHRFLVKSRVVGDRHSKKAKAEVVESYIAPDDIEIGRQKVKKGSWVLGVHVTDGELWRAIKAGEYQSFSVGGFGVREEVA